MSTTATITRSTRCREPKRTEDRSLEAAFADELARPTDTPPCEEFDAHGGYLRRCAYLARGRYAEQLTRWFDSFPREQLLILDTAGLTDPAGTGAAALCDFLGLADIPVIVMAKPLTESSGRGGT